MVHEVLYEYANTVIWRCSSMLVCKYASILWLSKPICTSTVEFSLLVCKCGSMIVWWYVSVLDLKPASASLSQTSVALTVLEMERVDLECAVNNREHHTELNGVDRLIVRRGQPFTITLYLRTGTHFQHGHNIRLITTTGTSLTLSG